MKVKALRGTVQFEGGTFEKGEVFEVPESKLKQFAVGTIEIIPETTMQPSEPVPEKEMVEAKPFPEISLKPRKKA